VEYERLNANPQLGVIIRFERRRGIALTDDSDDATLAD
jgi:hypothetical protein